MATPETETPVLDLILTMTKDSIAASTLDEKELMLARIAALVAVDAPPASYLLNLEAASEVGIDLDDVRGVFAAIAPIVGTPRIVHAAGNIYRALGAAYELAEFEEYEVTGP
jgi:alkylhydroperoxidase/carboxymuconolactone decarboxylase family protein YurZ